MAKSNIYFSDNTGTKLNIFEKATKVGGKFYYIYLDKNIITENQVGELTKAMQGFPVSDVRTKKGKIAYQVSWTFQTQASLAIQEEMFKTMFGYLNSIGYVDTYDPNKSSTSVSLQSKRKKSTEVSNFQVGDKFYYGGNKNVTWEVTKVEDGKVFIRDDKNKIEYGWRKIKAANQEIEKGNIEFINKTTSVPQIATNQPASASNTYLTDNEVSDIVDALQAAESEIWDELGISSGSKLYSDETLQQQYVIKLGKKIEAEVNKDLWDLFKNSPVSEKIKVFNRLADENYHSLNNFLSLSGYFGEDSKKNYVGLYEESKKKGYKSFLNPAYFPKADPTSVTVQTKDTLEVGEVFNFINPSSPKTWNEKVWVVTKIEGDNFFIKEVGTNDDFNWTNRRSLKGFFEKGQIKVLSSATQTTATPVTPTPTTPQKSVINNAEIDALKKEMADLIFLKDNTSDLNFEEKIELSTEINTIKKKIDDLNEKLFEQSVGEQNFFDKIFEQSFTPLRDRYNMVITKNESPEFVSPSGDISDLNENLQKIVNTEEFKEWFGDWRNAFFYRNLEDFGGLNISKVLSEKFEPLLVWHGTNNEFSYFKFEQFPANYFAVNKEYSEFFATNKGGNGYVLPFFLSIKHPLDLSDFGNESISSKDFFDWMYLNTGMSAEQLEVNPMFLDPSLPPMPVWMYIRNNPTMLKKLSDNKVFDGIKFYEYNPNLDPQRTRGYNPNVPADVKPAYETLAYIVFDPHQVKLADPERGEIMLASFKSFMLKRGGKI